MSAPPSAPPPGLPRAQEVLDFWFGPDPLSPAHFAERLHLWFGGDDPPEIIADLMESGVCMAGGGALLQGLCERLQEELKIRVWVAEDPMTCVARGAGRVLEDYDNLRKLLVGLERGSTAR